MNLWDSWLKTLDCLSVLCMDAEEAKEMLVSMLVISVAIAIAWVGLKQFLSFAIVQSLFYISIILVTVGSGFILHELAHRFVARKFGAYAVYKMWPVGLLVALIFSFMGFVFAAPGAVYIFAPYLTRRQNGLISLAGPLTNVLLALIFMVVFVFAAGAYAENPGELVRMLQSGSLPLELQIPWMGLQVNLFLAFFNMIPIFPLDGSKVLAWNPWIWGIVTIPLALLVFV